MTAAKLCSNKSEAKSPLPENKNYGSRIIDAIDSIKIFPNHPLLHTCMKFSFSLTFILVELFFILPPVTGYVLASLFGFPFFHEPNGRFSAMTSALKSDLKPSCVVGEVRDFRGELEYRECIIILIRDIKKLWISCLIIVYILPEFINAFLCFRKAKKNSSIGQFFLVFIPETLHTVGMALMIFEVLPKINYSYCVLFLIWCVIEWGLQTPVSTIYGPENIARKSLLIVADIVALGIFIYFTIVNPFDGINRNNSGSWVAILAVALLHGGLWQSAPRSPSSLTHSLPPCENARKILKPVKDSIYAWVSLWKIIVFFASSYAIYAINHGHTTYLFTMFGNAFSLLNVTDIHFQRFVQVDLPDTLYNDELTIYSRSLLNPLLTLSVQITMALFINTRTNSAMMSIIKKLHLPSYRGLNIPLTVSILFVMYSEYFRSLNSYLFYHIPLSEQLKIFFSKIHVPNVFSKFLCIESQVNSGAILLMMSLCWIVVNFFFRKSEEKNSKVDKKSENPETETPPIVEVHVISENKMVEEKETVEKK